MPGNSWRMAQRSEDAPADGTGCVCVLGKLDPRCFQSMFQFAMIIH